ncbi:MAG TPA: acetate uptake transporter [Candidatus Binatia bacterium]|nr:acetate uptake transporter [Candidatus Binatia bacterium]
MTADSTTPSPSSALALGLAAFALNLFLVSVTLTGVVPAATFPVFVASGFFYGFAQILVGLHEYRIGSSFTGLVFGSFGAFWMATAFLVLLQTTGVLSFGDAAGPALGLYFVAWTIFTLYLWIGSFVLNRVAWAIFTVLLIALVLFDLAEFGLVPIAYGAWVALLDALLAWYLSAALVLNELFGRTVLPLGSPLVQTGSR